MQHLPVALLYPGDRAMRDRANPAESRFAPLFDAFAAAGLPAVPAVYHDDFCDEVEAQLQAVRLVKRRLESGWIEQLRWAINLPRDKLPLLWDCDFMLGETPPGGPERYVLCEINVSSVSPFPPSAIAPIVAAVKRH